MGAKHRWSRMREHSRYYWMISAGVDEKLAAMFKCRDWEELPEPIEEKLIKSWAS